MSFTTDTRGQDYSARAFQKYVMDASPYFSAEAYCDYDIARWVLKVTCEAGRFIFTKQEQANISFLNAGSRQAWEFLARTMVVELWNYIVQQLGEYPAAKLWMLANNKGNFIEVKRATWQWKCFKEAHEGLVAVRKPTYEGLVPDPNYKFNPGFKHFGIATKLPEIPILPLISSNGYTPTQVILDEAQDLPAGILNPGREDMADRKVKIVKPKTKRNVKRPQCPVHHVDMAFNSARQVWECKEYECKLIARPKAERVEGQVLIGKGKTELRMVIESPGTKARLLAISDDNIAVDVSDLLQTVDSTSADKISAAIERGTQEGSTMVSVPDLKLAGLFNLTIVGLDNAAT